MRTYLLMPLLMLAFTFSLSHSAAPLQAQGNQLSGVIDWNGWTFTYDVSGSYWVDYNCNEHFYKALRTGRYYWQHTYGNNVWRVYDGSGTLRKEVTARNQVDTVYIR